MPNLQVSHLTVGGTARIRRSDGRIHMCQIYGFDDIASDVTLTWVQYNPWHVFEEHFKTISAEEFFAINPHLQQPEDEALWITVLRFAVAVIAVLAYIAWVAYIINNDD